MFFFYITDALQSNAKDQTYKIRNKPICITSTMEMIHIIVHIKIDIYDLTYSIGIILYI